MSNPSSKVFEQTFNDIDFYIGEKSKIVHLLEEAGHILLEIGGKKVSVTPFKVPFTNVAQITLIKKERGNLFIDSTIERFDPQNLQEFNIFGLRGTRLEIEILFTDKTVKNFIVLFCTSELNIQPIEVKEPEVVLQN